MNDIHVGRPALASLPTRFTDLELLPVRSYVPALSHSLGDFLGFNPHCHDLCTDGGFYGKGMFRVAPWIVPRDLEKLFRHKVFKMLLSRKKTREDLIDIMMSWRHSGFNVYFGPRIQPGEEEAMENLARYVVRASFSQERMTYVPKESEILYRSKDGNKGKTFDALEWLTARCSYVAGKGSKRLC